MRWPVWARAAGELAAEVTSRQARLNVVALEARYYSRMSRHKLEDRLIRMSRQAGTGPVKREELTASKTELVTLLLGGGVAFGPPSRV